MILQQWLRGAVLVVAVVVGTPVGVATGWFWNEAYVETQVVYITPESNASGDQLFVTDIRNQSQIVKLQKSSLRYNPALWVIVGGCLGFLTFNIVGKALLRIIVGSETVP
jgi:hypothetical protein